MALYYQKNNVIVTIITNDNNLKIKANSLDILALSYEEYKNQNTEKNNIKQNDSEKYKHSPSINNDLCFPPRCDIKCEKVCPVHAIVITIKKMPYGASGSFPLYKFIVKLFKDKCINCGKCVKVCPGHAIVF